MVQDEFRIVIEGYKDLQALLKTVDPDLRKEMNRTIRDVLRPIALRAKTYVPVQPLSGWNYGGDRYAPSRLPFWNYDDTVRNIKIDQPSKRAKGSALSTVWRIRNQAPSGAVFELAGRGPSTHPFVASLAKTHGRPSRLIWRAWDEAGGAKVVSKKVVDIVDDYGRVFAEDLNNITGK